MRPIKMSLAMLALSTGAGALSGTADELRFEPRAGLALRKSFRVERESSSAGNEALGPGWNNKDSSTYTLVVTDRVKAVTEGRVTELERKYDEVGWTKTHNFQTGEHSSDSSNVGSSPVEGSTVTFEWNEDDEDYAASSEDVDDDVLAKLLHDLDFGQMLPEGEVSEGDEWKVDIEAFERLRDPWQGLCGGRPASARSESERTSTDGEIVATYDGKREEDGVTVAVIRLAGKIDLEYTSDREVHDMNDPTRVSGSIEKETAETQSIRGELLWSVTGGHLHQLRLDAVESAASKVRMDLKGFAAEHDEERTDRVEYVVSMGPPE